ncbi:MAG: FliJ family protein [bacterium]|nr:FliJ family protein [bacterium]
MNRLARLIRLAKSQLDEKRLILNTLEQKQDEMKTRYKVMEASLEKEIKTVPFEFQQNLEAFIHNMKDQCRTLRLKIKKLDVEIDKARDQLREGFKNLKTLEIAAQKEQEELLRIFKKKEGELLDEAASRRALQRVSFSLCK